MEVVNMVKIVDYIDETLICLDLKSKNKEEMLKELGELIGNSKNIIDKKEVCKALIEREKIGSTGIGKGVGIPHAKTESATGLTIAFGISRSKIDFNSLDEEKVNIFFVFASPLRDGQTYLKVLARISRLLRDEEFRKQLLNAKTEKEVIELIRVEEGI